MTLIDLDRATWTELRASMLAEYARDPGSMDPEDIPAADKIDPCATLDMHQGSYIYSVDDDLGDRASITYEEAYMLARLNLARIVFVTPVG